MIRLNQHLQIDNPEDVTKLEEAFVKELESRGAEFAYYQVITGLKY